MPSILTFRRGTAAQNDAFTGSAGEITVDNTNGTLRVHDGVTAGGSQLATQGYVSTQLGTLGDLATLNTVGTSQITDGSITQAKFDAGVSFGGLVKTDIHYNADENAVNPGTWVWWEYSGLTYNYTMSDTSNSVIVTFSVNAQSDNHQGSILFQYSTNGGSSYTSFPNTNPTGTNFGDVHAEIYMAHAYGKLAHVRQFKITPGANFRVRTLIGQDSNSGTITTNRNIANGGIGSNGGSSVSFMEVSV